MFSGGFVSVPLPGFSGLRQPPATKKAKRKSFSPVAGIQWVETIDDPTVTESKEVSVPLPGFSGLRLCLFVYQVW